MDLEKIEKKITKLSNSLLPSTDLEKGISIILPVYEGNEYLEKCLQSIDNQEITDAKFEVIIVLNGSFKEELLYLTNHSYDNLDILILINDEASAGEARNLGMTSAKYSHITFVDVDDYISKEYIQANYNLLNRNTITISQIHDVYDNQIIKDNIINTEVIKNAKPASVSLLKINRISSITVCKVIPKEIAISQRFRGNLRSGEDTVFYSELFVNNRPKLKIVPINDKAIYFRKVIKNSVSRKDSSYDFSISQRLDILEILDQLLDKVNNPTLQKFIKMKYNAQINFMKHYLEEFPKEKSKVFGIISAMSFNHFNFSILNKEITKKLVVSYCFPPYSDTSATVVSKRLLEQNEPFDVVYNSMNKIRKKEYTVDNMIKHLYGSKKVVYSTPSFSNMYYLNDYVDEAFKFYIQNKDKYNLIYSRAMFPISHFPPLFIKILTPDIKWTAEFSDPLLKDIESNLRYSDIRNNELVNSLKSGILGEFTEYVDENLFNLAELIPFALADNLIFTNENQLEYMISRFNNKLQSLIRAKACISSHPTLPYKYYNTELFEYPLEDSVINLAYFGNFYSKRGFLEFKKLIDILNNNYNQIFKLHIFTNKNQLVNEQITDLENNLITVNEYLSYEEFLNATTKFDVLLLNDSYTIGDKHLNPYLPSKLSDYLGSNNFIVALTEKNSVMSKIENSNLFKIDISLFSRENDEKDLYLNKEIIELVDSLALRKAMSNKRHLYKDNELILKDEYQNEILTITDNLVLKNISYKDWVIHPKELPIYKNNKYIIKIFNQSNINKRIKIKSFYSVPNIIEILIKQNESIKSKFCISELRKEFITLEIEANKEISIQINYKKNYQKEGFLRAGRIRLQDV